MSRKYHVNKNGVPAVCKADKEPCPLGGFHGSKEEVIQQIEKTGAEEHGVLLSYTKNNENSEDYTIAAVSERTVNPVVIAEVTHIDMNDDVNEADFESNTPHDSVKTAAVLTPKGHDNVKNITDLLNHPTVNDMNNARIGTEFKNNKTGIVYVRSGTDEYPTIKPKNSVFDEEEIQLTDPWAVKEFLSNSGGFTEVNKNDNLGRVDSYGNTVYDMDSNEVEGLLDWVGNNGIDGDVKFYDGAEYGGQTYFGFYSDTPVTEETAADALINAAKAKTAMEHGKEQPNFIKFLATDPNAKNELLEDMDVQRTHWGHRTVIWKAPLDKKQ